MKAVVVAFVLALALISGLYAHSQTQRIADLQHRIASAAEPRQALDATIQLLEEHESLFKDSLMPLALRAVSLAKRLNDKVALGYAYVGLVNAHLRLDNAQTA